MQSDQVSTKHSYNITISAQAQSKIKILEKLPPLEAPPKDDMEGLGEGEGSIYFTFPSPEKLSPPILQMENVTFGYTSERIILKNVSFDLQMDSKIGIVGPNVNCSFCSSKFRVPENQH